jgi:hypothetical protein
MADDVYAARAAETFEAISAPSLFNARTRLWGHRKWCILRNNEPLWPFTGAWAATCALAALPGQERANASLPGCVSGLGAYHRDRRSALTGRGPIGFESAAVFPHGTGGDVYYDDNAWLGLALCRHDALIADDRVCELSRRVLRFILEGWSSDQEWDHPGGIRWKVPVSSTSRNTCSNAPAAELAALIAMRDHDGTALDWSKRIYLWVHETLLGEDGLYLDRIDPNGHRDPTVWSYNQGTMIGAGVLLHRATGVPDYLSQARLTARSAVAQFRLDRLVDQDAAFNTVFFRNLLLLDEVEPDPAYRTLAQEYADRMWESRRDPELGLFSGGSSFLNATAPLIEVYALLAGSRPQG